MFRKRTHQHGPTGPLNTSPSNGSKDISHAGGEHSKEKAKRPSLLRDGFILLFAFLAPIVVLEFISPTRTPPPQQQQQHPPPRWTGLLNMLTNPMSLFNPREKGTDSGAATSTTTPADTNTATPAAISSPSTTTAVAANSVSSPATPIPSQKQQEQPKSTTKGSILGPPPPPLTGNDTLDKKIAYVVPFWSCGENSNTANVEAVMILRHSIHQQSVRNPTSGSSFDYQMYALVLKSKKCPTEPLKALGFKVVPVDPPVIHEKIQSQHVRDNIGKSGEGGILQYIQLLAHSSGDVIPEPIVVLLYPHSLVLKPLDELFLAMLHGPDTPQGQAARAHLQSKLERPHDNLQREIHHYIVRDYPNSGYGRKPVVMTPGFWIARRNPALLETAIKLAYNTNYVSGNGPTSGWDGKGYTTYYRHGLSFPGIYTYLLDEFYAGSVVELDGCKFSHNGMDNLFRAAPRYHPSQKEHTGECRSAEKECGDCTTTDIQSIYTINYGRTCFSPHRCYGEGSMGGNHLEMINIQSTTVEHCMVLQKEWHGLRSSVEDVLLTQPGFELLSEGRKGAYKTEIFHGHCTGHGEDSKMALTVENVPRVKEFLWDG
ncbi:expressed unknown protein [Seminavis robusta]|uniref:Uncharacterized protein n=1 Tax=Seminavis robusta TaxID=568900 RepID=A0A9N8HQ08_9STRA|nr:expressed unknown protein [Seminavis robusta]|eukprot:Sro1386_g268300.1 n/a (599) ;mRNA; r:18309-20247